VFQEVSNAFLRVYRRRLRPRVIIEKQKRREWIASVVCCDKQFSRYPAIHSNMLYFSKVFIKKIIRIWMFSSVLDRGRCSWLFFLFSTTSWPLRNFLTQSNTWILDKIQSPNCAWSPVKISVDLTPSLVRNLMILCCATVVSISCSVVLLTRMWILRILDHLQHGY